MSCESRPGQTLRCSLTCAITYDAQYSLRVEDLGVGSRKGREEPQRVTQEAGSSLVAEKPDRRGKTLACAATEHGAGDPRNLGGQRGHPQPQPRVGALAQTAGINQGTITDSSILGLTPLYGQYEKPLYPALNVDLDLATPVSRQSMQRLALQN